MGARHRSDKYRQFSRSRDSMTQPCLEVVVSNVLGHIADAINCVTVNNQKKGGYIWADIDFASCRVREVSMRGAALFSGALCATHFTILQKVGGQ